MKEQHTVAELELLLGENIKNLRLQRNIGQVELARQSGVSRNALQSLENGGGSTLSTLVQVVRALGRVDWIDALAPAVTISPLTIARGTPQRHRATTTKGTHGQQKTSTV